MRVKKLRSKALPQVAQYVAPVPYVPSYILREDGGFVLREDGGKIVRES